MTTATFVDLEHVEIEHILGDTGWRPIVKIRAICDNGNVIALGQIEPNDARQIACHLFECAARAEYEADLAHEAVEIARMPENLLADLIHMVRGGEARRHERGEGSPGAEIQER